MENFTADNSSSSNSCPNDAVCILETTIIIAVAFTSLTSNLMNITVLLTTPAFRNSHGYLLLSLSVSDLLIGVVAALSIYPSATLQDSPDSWPYGDIVCAISTYLLQIAILISGITLTAMSVERYIAVAHPFKYSRIVTKTKTLLYIAIVWIISILVFVFGIPGYTYAGYVYTCAPLLNDNSIFAYILFFAVVLPGIIIIIITSLIVRLTLKKNAKQLSNSGPSSTSQDDRSSQATSPRTIKLFRLVRIMTIAVIVCWIPFMSLLIVDISFDVHVPQVLYFLTFWMLISNAFVNSIIYFGMNTAFHNRLKEISAQLTPSCCRQLSEFEKNLDCTLCVCCKGGKVDLKTSGDNANNTPQQDIQVLNNSVELVRVEVQGVDNISVRIG